MNKEFELGKINFNHQNMENRLKHLEIIVNTIRRDLNRIQFYLEIQKKKK